MFRFLTLKVIIYVLLLLGLDMTLSSVFAFGDARFYLMYLLIAYVAFHWGWQKAIPMAIVVGVCRDLVSTQGLGVETVSLVMAAWLLEIVVQKMYRDPLILRMMITFVFVLFVFVVQFALTSILFGMCENLSFYLGSAYQSSLYSAIILPGFIFVTSKWFRDRITVKQYELF